MLYHAKRSEMFRSKEVLIHIPYDSCVTSRNTGDDTVKPVCNDHLYDKIYHLWSIL